MPTMNFLTRLSLATAGTAVVALSVAETANAAGFSGAYNPNNWTLTNNNADGSVDTTNAPLSITTTGGNNGSDSFGQTAYTTIAANNSVVSFDWNYFTFDGPFYDPFGFIRNGVFTELTDSFGAFSQSGSFSTVVNAGDTFGFAINTTDNLYDPATATISNFHVAVVPEPASLIGVLGLGAFGVTSLRKRKATVQA
ncbi:PEP-CTERM sorting domain-containing protein [Richelia sinica]|nr:PEP-CTERM sorting domain-containing protein [Richelia sinica]MBD2665623.1 PEP-CTERM sorting domain-containing protein [Richelia sinica FACHB-800]